MQKPESELKVIEQLVIVNIRFVFKGGGGGGGGGFSPDFC